METDRILDQLLIPRAGGSEGLAQTASFIEATLRLHTPNIELHTFYATPHGFQILMSTIALLTLGFAAASLLRRYRVALLLLGAAMIVPLLETELLWSPVSGLLGMRESNIVGIFAAAEDAPTLILSAHYDTATQFGDHLVWDRWSRAMGAAAIAGAILALMGLRRHRQGRRIPTKLAGPVLALAVAPSLAMAWFFAVGPLLQAPSPGALDNGGSVSVLLRLAERLASRPADAPTRIKLVFFSAEEERTLGSWRYAETIDPGSRVAVINLETLGTREPIGYIPEEGFQIRRFPPSPRLLGALNEVARATLGSSIQPVAIPRVLVTDARSFLARGIPALTLVGPSRGAWPRDLHSSRDSRDRLSLDALEDAVDLLAALIAHIDHDAGGVIP